jgi:hypothetical protein
VLEHKDHNHEFDIITDCAIGGTFYLSREKSDRKKSNPYGGKLTINMIEPVSNTDFQMKGCIE